MIRQGRNTESRRAWLARTAAMAAGAEMVTQPFGHAMAEEPGQALIAVTLDLEMSRNFPTRDSVHWDYEKGNLNEETKQYAVEAARRVKAAGGLMHFFAVGRMLEQENVQWAEEIAEQGHLIGNHTYDHVNVTAQRPEDLQFRFRRAPWLIEGQSVSDVIRSNIRLCDLALQQRLDRKADGFRTPGGFRDGLRNHPHVRDMLLELGFTWVSSLYPKHPYPDPGQQPTSHVIDAIVQALADAQPFAYPDGLIEIPMSPISDIGAFRTCQWDLEWFLTVVEHSVQWAIKHNAVYDFPGHPSCLYVVDPEFRAIDLICRLVADAGDRAKIADLNTIAQQVRP